MSYTKLAILTVGFVPYIVQGTHLRAGEILYRHVGGLTYEAIVNIYTKVSPPSNLADKCYVIIDWGDGQQDTIYRVNGPMGSGCPDGVMIGNDVKHSIYKGTHTYNGPGTYMIRVLDPNLTGGVCNIPGSDNLPMCLESMLVISSFLGYNNSPVFGHIPLDTACANSIFTYLPMASDADGDSLVYEIMPALGSGCAPQLGYQPPDVVGGGNLSINPYTGILTWSYPVNPCEYDFSVKVKEYRGGVLVGYVVRQFQIWVMDTCRNKPPVINAPNNICDTAGNTISATIYAYDPDHNGVSISSWGEPYNVTLSPASFSITQTTDSTAYGNFTWHTSCWHVRPLPYTAYFAAEDISPYGSLVALTSTQINIVALEPQNPQLTWNGNNIVVSWSPAPCPNVSCYKIYRRIDSVGYQPPQCVTGVPPSTGYSLIGTTSGYTSTTFIDSNGGIPFVPGTKICYMITGCFDNGAETYPTREICITIPFYVPLIIKASVVETSLSNGKDTVAWLTPYEIDTTVFKPPWKYRLFRNNILIWESPLFHTLGMGDTTYLDTGINTVSMQHTYHVEIWSDSGKVLAGISPKASTPFLTTHPQKNRIDLTWQYQVPWNNYKHLVWRQDTSTQPFNIIATTYKNHYSDAPLINGKQYCYYITTIGKLAGVSSYQNYILNNSQIKCEVPWDYVAPCPPDLTLDTPWCEAQIHTLKINYWECDSDAFANIIYYSPIYEGPYYPVDTIEVVTSYSREMGNGEGGCYFITTIDTFNNVSPPSDTVCFEYCYALVLPNVFTPNNDGINDYFTPIIKKNISAIYTFIYDRWGVLIKSSSDDVILWDGTNKEGVPVPTGTYYYVCEYYPTSPYKTQKRIAKGFVHLLRPFTNIPK